VQEPITIQPSEREPGTITEEQEQTLRQCVRYREVLISFKKKDGSNRDLLTSPKISEDKMPKNQKPYSFECAPILHVFEKPSQMWKSIRISSIYAWSAQEYGL
jgi:hypothetical protein